LAFATRRLGRRSSLRVALAFIPPDLQPSLRSLLTLNGLMFGAVAFPSSVSGAMNATEMPMFS
jgi:hypothetical protein